MALTGTELLEGCFPTLDTEVKDYVIGILDGGAEDFATADDLYDAVGDMLLGCDVELTEEDVRGICERLLHVIKGEDDGSGDSKEMKRLDAPVHLGQQVSESMVDCLSLNTGNNLWIKPRDVQSSVDQKKLEKAEAQINKKRERREKDDKGKTNGFVPESASASQQSNRVDNKMDASGTNKTYDVKIENFDIAFGSKVLLKSADVQMAYGRRYGLVGRNGIGKTTLLKMIATKELRIPSHISVLHVEQEVVGDDTVAVDSVLEVDTVRTALLNEEKEISAKLASTSPSDNTLSTRLAAVYHELELIEADKAPSQAALILNGLGFSPKMQRMTTREFSGGWRMRLALARALFSKPDLLLLDEPTNMLDMKAIIWLENYLQTWPTTILVVSHDRQFLNSVATDILHMHTQKIDTYKGDFELFVKTRTEKMKNQQREYDAQKQYRDHIQVFIDRFRYNANRASQVQSKLKLLEKLPELQAIEKETEVTLKFPEVEKLSPPILQCDEVTYYYNPDTIIFEKICISAGMDSRICIVGENGAGKTTLLKVLLGEYEPTTGVRHAHRNLRIGYFSQHHVDQLEMNVSCAEVLQSKLPGHPVEFYRQQLGSFGVTGELGLRPVASLSGGQKSRVAFALMSMMNPNFFVLDEPTNHLDMETIEALGKALQNFKGGVILVSHDERLIRMICKELWVCKDKKVISLEGGIDEYKKIVQVELAAQS